VSAVLNADVSLSVTVTDVHNCTATDNAQITVLSSPQVEAGNSLIVCDTPDPITLTGFSPSGGTWSGTGVSAGGIFTPNGTGVFTLTYNFSQAGCSGSDQLQITVNAVPVPDAGLNQQVCIGSAPIALSGSPSGGMWTGTGNLTSGGTFTPDAAGTFMLHYHVGMGNCAVEDSMSIQVYDLPQLSVNDAQYCSGQSATLTASLSGTPGPYTYSWSPGTGLSSTSGVSVTSTVSSSQLYTVTASDGVGCSVSAQSQVTVIPAPTVNAGSDLQICTYPLPLQLVDFSPAGGTWSGPSVTPSGIFTAAAVGSYTLTYSYSLPNGCTSTDAVVIDVALPPVLNAGPNVIVCEDAAPLQLQANLPAAWSGSPHVDNSGLFQIPVPGTYSVIATNGTGTCQVRDTLQIQVVTLPSVLVADTNTCALHPVSVTAQTSGGAGGYQYTWSPPAGLNTTTGATVQAGPAATTTYTVTVSDANGCTATDQMILSTIPIPPVNVGPDISQCVSSTPIPLPAAVPNTGVWSGSGISGTDFIPSTAGVFEVYYTVTGANGCTNADTLVFSINPLPLVDAGPNLSLCLGGPSLQLTPTAPLTGTWSGGVGANGIFDPITVGSSTVYWTSGTGTCEVMDSLVITVQPLPLVNAGNDTTVCVSAAAWVLDGLPAAGGTGVWTGTGVNAGSFDPQLSGLGTFDLIYAFTQTSTGCLNRDTLQAVVIAVPQIALNPPNMQVCLSGIPSLLTASPNGGTWTASGVTLSADLQAPADSVWMLPTALGNFEAVYTFSSGSQCIARDTVSIQVIPTPQANAGNDTAFCVGQTGVQLQGLPAGGTWPAAFNPSWLGTAGQVNTTSADTAWVVYQTGTGTCLDRDSARVALFPNPVVDAGPPISACADASCINLTGASPAGGSWTGNGIMGNQFCPTMAGAGTYNLTYTASATFTYQSMSASCSANDLRVATVYALPTADFSMVSPICRNTTTVPVNLSVGGQTYTWTLIALPSNTTVATYTGSSPVIAPPDSGTYQVHLEVVSAQGCEASVTYPLQVNGPPVMQLDIPPATVCGPWPLTVNVQSSGTINQYAWDFGPLFPPSNLASPAFPVLPAPIINDTLYFVNLTVSNVCGSTSDYDSVRVRPQPVADIQTDYSQGCSPMTVVLQNISYGSPDSFDWDFGNGQSSTDSLPSSVVLTASNLPQVYVIHLDIQNTCGSASDSVAVTVFPDAISLGGIVPQIACAPYTFSFAAPVSGQTFYLWDFGDGTGSIGQQVSHEYEDAGTYALSLTVSNFCVSDTATAVMTLLEGPDLSLDLSSNALCAGSSITLNNTSTNGSQFEWLPDNGTVLPYSNPVSVSYPLAGSFSTGIAGTNTATGCRDTVYEALNVYTAPEIQVTADPDTGCAPLVAHFINTSTGANSWEWQFSNGEMSTLIEPVVQFSGVGSFSATVIARNILSNQEVCADTAVVNVWVLPTPTSTFDLAANAGCGPPASVQTINNSAAGLQYRWEWDGNVDLNFAPTLSFADTGNHSVNLIVTNEFACSDTSIRGFRVNGKPQLAWTIDPDYGCAPLEVVMHNTSTFSEAVQWNISNGMQTLGDTMAVTLSEPGFYDVQLTVSNTDGACSSDTLLVQGIRVFPNPVASFIAAQTLLSESDPVVSLLNTSSGYSTLQFEVKDEILPGLPAVYQFSEGDTGVYAMVLYAENEFGCRDTFMQQIEIDEAPVFYVPSSFSPNGDGVNDEFLIMLDREPQEFEALIYNRWGELVFRTKDPHEGWKGTKNNRDRPLVEEVYVLKLNLRFFGKDREVVYRNITVIQ
jgi:gliding motility-associated-like protein